MKFNPKGTVELLSESMDRMIDYDGATRLDEIFGAKDLYDALAPKDFGEYKPSEPEETEDEGPENPNLETDYIDDVRRMGAKRDTGRDKAKDISNWMQSGMSKEDAETLYGQMKTQIGSTQTKGLDQAVKLQVEKFLAGEMQEFPETERRIARYKDYSREPDEYAAFVTNYVKTSHLGNFSKVAGENADWENEHIGNAMSTDEVRGKLDAIQKERDAALAKMPQEEMTPPDKAKWSEKGAEFHLPYIDKAGKVFKDAIAGIEQYKPEAVTKSIDELYGQLPQLVNDGINHFLDEVDFENAFRAFVDAIASMKGDKETTRQAVGQMMGGVVPYADETVTDRRTGRKTRRWDAVHGRIDTYQKPVEQKEIIEEIDWLPASPLDEELEKYRMYYGKRMARVSCFLYPDLKSLDIQGMHSKFEDVLADSSFVEALAAKFFQLIKSGRLSWLAARAKKEAGEQLKDREYQQQSADALARFNASDEPEGDQRMSITDRNKMVSVMVQNKIIPGRELFKYLDGINSAGYDGLKDLIGESRVFKPKGELPKVLPARPGGPDDFVTNDKGEITRRSDTGSPIRINRNTVMKNTMQSALNTLKPTPSKAIGTSNEAGFVNAEDIIEILDAYLGKRTFEEGALSLSSQTGTFMTGGGPRKRGRQAANAGKLSTWFAEFVEMINDTPDEDKAAFFSSCAKAGFPVDQNSLFDLTAPEQERVNLGRAYLLFRWATESGQPANAIDINRLFVPDTKGQAQHLFKSKTFFEPDDTNPILYGGEKNGAYFGTRDEALARPMESFSKYESAFRGFFDEVLFS